MADLLGEFEQLCDENVRTLASRELTPRHLDLRGVHPEFGPVTLRQLLAAWTVHDLHHMSQVCKSMAFQYGDAVGPWKAYLGTIPSPSPA